MASFGNLFGGNKQSSTNSTQNYDQSHNEAVTSQSGAAVFGSQNIINDAGLISLGQKNNDIAASVIGEINKTNTALIGKLADTVKQTSNDGLNTALAGAASNQTTALATNSFLKSFTENAFMGVALAAGAFLLFKYSK